MKKKFVFIILATCVCVFACAVFTGNGVASADSLSDGIEKELSNLDLTALEDFFNSVTAENKDFSTLLNSMLKGEFNVEYNDVFEYLINVFLKDIFNALPTFLSIIAIAILCAVVQSVKSSVLSESVAEVILFVCVLGVVLITSAEMISVWRSSKEIINKIADLSEIISPILLTLMVASGGTVSASIYKPTVAFLSNGIINIVEFAVIPLVGLMIVFAVVNAFSKNVKLSKMSDCLSSVIKWALGISFTVYGLFVSVQGISGAVYDGVSVKAAKYAISNSIPIIGGYLKDGFDIMVAGSVLIKNTVGVVGIFAIFYVVIAPVLHLAVLSTLFKFTSAITEPVTNSEIPNLCVSFSKGLTYITVAILTVGFMLFITLLLMLFSANAFI